MAVEQYRQDEKLRPEYREGYITWQTITSREDLCYSPEAKSVIFDIITTREDVSYKFIEYIMFMSNKVITAKLDNVIDSTKEKEHTMEEFSEIIAQQSEINNLVKIFRMVIKYKYTNEQKNDYTK